MHYVITPKNTSYFQSAKVCGILFLMSKKGTKDVGYTYDTEIGVLEENLNIKTGVPPNTKLGDFFKSRGYSSFARILKIRI